MDDHIWIVKIEAILQGGAFEPEDVRAGFVTGDDVVVVVGSPATVLFLADQVDLRVCLFVGV